MLTSAAPKRRTRAVQVYAVLCALTGLSGIMLSLWAHPLEQADRLARAAVQYEGQSQIAELTPENRRYLSHVARDLKQQVNRIVPVDAPATQEFRGVALGADAL